MDLNAFIRTADPRKVRIVERARAEYERPIVTMAKHRTVTLLPTSVVRSSRELSASVEREFVGDPVKAEIPRPKRSKKKRVTYDSEGLPAASHPPKRLRADYGTTGGSATGALPTLPFITSSVTASPLEEGRDRTESVTGPSLRTIGPSARFVVLSDSSHHSGAKSADPEVDFLVRSAALVMTVHGMEHEQLFTEFNVSAARNLSLSSEVRMRAEYNILEKRKWRSLAEEEDILLEAKDKEIADLKSQLLKAKEESAEVEEIYVPEWTVTKGFELNDGRLCANMIDHFTPTFFFKTVRRIEHEQLFTEFNVSAARNLSLSSEVRMRAEYNILEKRKWRSLAEEKNILLEAKDKEIEDLKSQLLKAKEESAEVTQLRAQVSGLEATENSLRGEVASAKDHNVLLEQECNSLKLKVTGLESTIAEKDHELSDLGASSSSLKSQNQSLVRELEISSADLREKLEMYEGSLKKLKEFQDNLMGPFRTRLAEIDANFTRCCMRFQESFHPHLLNVVAGRRWLLTHGMKLIVVKCLNSNEYMEALGHAFGRAIEKGMMILILLSVISVTLTFRFFKRFPTRGMPALGIYGLSSFWRNDADGLRHRIGSSLGAKRCPLLWIFAVGEWRKWKGILLNVPATNVLSTVVIAPHIDPSISVEDYDNPDLADVVLENATLGLESREKIDVSARGDLTFSQLDDEARDAVLNLIERLPFLKDVFVSINDPLSAEALIEPPAQVPATNVLSTMVIVPHTDPSVSVEDYDNPDSADVVLENATLGSQSEGKIDASARGGLTFSQLDDEARDAVL
ncbi:hypothetical protein Tco_0430814 [Tanacetum coccineum]